MKTFAMFMEAYGDDDTDKEPDMHEKAKKFKQEAAAKKLAEEDAKKKSKKRPPKKFAKSRIKYGFLKD